MKIASKSSICRNTCKPDMAGPERNKRFCHWPRRCGQLSATVFCGHSKLAADRGRKQRVYWESAQRLCGEKWWKWVWSRVKQNNFFVAKGTDCNCEIGISILKWAMRLDFVARARNAPKNIAIMKREGFAAFADVALELCEKLFYNDNNHEIASGRKLKKRLKTKASGLCVKHARALFFSGCRCCDPIGTLFAILTERVIMDKIVQTKK